MSLTCHNCPDVVQALSLMAILNPKIKTTVIEGGAFQAKWKREIMAVPMVFLNGQVFGSGRMTVEEIVAKLDTNSAAAREAAKLSAKAPYDVLIVGGGPMVRQPPCTPPARASRTGVAGRALWRSGERHHGHRNYISVLRKPTAPSSPPRSKPTPAPTASTS